MSKNPESPRFRADKSRLFNTQIDAVALPGKWVRLKPNNIISYEYLLLNLSMFVGHRFF